MLFDSLQHKIKTQPDDVIVYPGHGAGSACGKNIGPNYALLTDDRDTFIKAVTSDLPVIPGYFFKDAAINKKGYKSFDDVMQSNMHPLTVDEFINKRKQRALVLDTRDPEDFAAGFIKGAINIGLNGDFAVWVGTLIDTDAAILLVTTPGKEKEAIERLARIGYENVNGYLGGGMNAWFSANNPYDNILSFNGEECTNLLETEEYNLLDVRNRLEVARHRMVGSVHIPLNTLRNKYATLDKNKKWRVYCAGGYRSMIAASFLKANGFNFIASIEGGIKEVIQHAPQLVEMDLE